MATKKSEIGKLGEDLACEYLVEKSFIICERNVRKPWGEIDIIAKDSGGILVFVEVKTISQSNAPGKYDLSIYAPNSLWQAIRQFGNAAMIRKIRQKIGWKESLQIQPEENLTAAKLRKLQRTASLYAGFNDNLIDEKKGWRIDLIAITLYGEPVEPLTDFDKNCDIKHFENI